MTVFEQSALHDAAKLLRHREYSKAELREKLGKKHPVGVVDTILHLLVNVGFVNDIRAAESLILSRTGRQAVGDAELRVHLEKMGLTLEEADILIQEFAPNEHERALELITVKFKFPTEPAKVGRFLYSRGFDESTIESVLEKLPW